MNNLFTSTTVLLTEEFVKSCSKETLQSKLTKLRLVTGIQFSKANKSFAVTGGWDQVDAAFEILTHWQAIPDHEPEFENDLDGKISKLCDCDCVKEFILKDKLHNQSESESRLIEYGVKNNEAGRELIEQTVEKLEKEFASLKDKLKFRRKDLQRIGKKCETTIPENRPLKCKILNKHKKEVEQNNSLNAGSIFDGNTTFHLDENDSSLQKNDSRLHEKIGATFDLGDHKFTVAAHVSNSGSHSNVNRRKESGAPDSTKSLESEASATKESENYRNETTELVSYDENAQHAVKKTTTKKPKKPGDKGYWSRVKRTDGDLSHHCAECDVTLKSRKRYLEHMRRIHIKEYQCKVCEKRFGYPTDLNRHKCPGLKTNEKNSGVKQFKEKKSAQSGSVEFQCLECSYVTPNKTRLGSHIQRKHRKEFACDQCESRFGYSKDLQKHVQNIHSDTRYFCDQCSKMYKNKQIFDSHVKTHETGYVKPYFECEQCSKSFTSKYSLTVHTKTLHLGLKKTYLCQMCGKKFTQRSSYKQHCNAHNGIKPYKCDICGKAFVYHKSLTEHKFMHDNIRRFFCIFCDKAFRQRTTLHIHLKTHKTVKDHICSVCGRGFAQKQAMERHERIHSGVRPYTCLVCNKSFGDTSTIRRHMISLHQKTETNWREEILSTVKKKSDYYVYGGTGQNRVYKSNPSKKSSLPKKKYASISDSQSKPMKAGAPVLQNQPELVQPEPSLIVFNSVQNNEIHDPKCDYANVVNGTSLNGNTSSVAQNFQTFQTLQPATIYAISNSQAQQIQQQNQDCPLPSPAQVDNGFSQVIDFSTMTFIATKLPNQPNDKLENGERSIQTPLLVQGQNTTQIQNATIMPQNATIVPLAAVTDYLKTGDTRLAPSTQASADSSLSQAIASVWGFVGYPSYQSPGNLTQYQPTQNQ